MPGPLRIIFLIFGSILLLSGLRYQATLEDGSGQIVPYFMILMGTLLNFLALKSMGDQKVKPSPRMSSDYNQTHIPSIEKPKIKKIEKVHIPSIDVSGHPKAPSFNEEKFDEVRELVRTGQIVAAIELYRQTTGHGLLESGRAIKIIAEEMMQDN